MWLLLATRLALINHISSRTRVRNHARRSVVKLPIVTSPKCSTKWRVEGFFLHLMAVDAWSKVLILKPLNLVQLGSTNGSLIWEELSELMEGDDLLVLFELIILSAFLYLHIFFEFI